MSGQIPVRKVLLHPTSASRREVLQVLAGAIASAGAVVAIVFGEVLGVLSALASVGILVGSAIVGLIVLALSAKASPPEHFL
jgi:hypothetical protein